MEIDDLSSVCAATQFNRFRADRVCDFPIDRQTDMLWSILIQSVRLC